MSKATQTEIVKAMVFANAVAADLASHFLERSGAPQAGADRISTGRVASNVIEILSMAINDADRMTRNDLEVMKTNLVGIFAALSAKVPFEREARPPVAKQGFVVIDGG